MTWLSVLSGRGERGGGGCVPERSFNDVIRMVEASREERKQRIPRKNADSFFTHFNVQALFEHIGMPS